MAGQVTGASAVQLAKKMREQQQEGAGKQPDPVPVPSSDSDSEPEPDVEDVHDPITEEHGTPASAREELSSDEEGQSMVEELLHHARVYAGKFGSNPPDTRPTHHLN